MQVESMSDDIGDDLDIVKMLKRWGEWQRSPCGSTHGGSKLVGSYSEWKDHGSGLMVNRDPQSERVDQLVFQMGCRMGIQYRHAIDAKYVQQYSNDLIADTLGLSVATVKVRIQSAEWWLNGVMFGVSIRIIP